VLASLALVALGVKMLDTANKPPANGGAVGNNNIVGTSESDAGVDATVFAKQQQSSLEVEVLRLLDDKDFVAGGIKAKQFFATAPEDSEERQDIENMMLVIAPSASIEVALQIEKKVAANDCKQALSDARDFETGWTSLHAGRVWKKAAKCLDASDDSKLEQALEMALSRERYAEGYAYCSVRIPKIEGGRAICAMLACNADGVDDAQRWIKGLSKEDAESVREACPLLQGRTKPRLTRPPPDVLVE
jgi:hypothetical protein